MDELMISGKRYISSRRAGKEYHYHADYIGQLIRAGKIAGQKVGRAWYVSEASLAAHLRKEAGERKENQKSSKRNSGVTIEQEPKKMAPALAVDFVEANESSGTVATQDSEIFPTIDSERKRKTEMNTSVAQVPQVSEKMLKYFSETVESIELKKQDTNRSKDGAESVHPTKHRSFEKEVSDEYEEEGDWEDEDASAATVSIPLRITSRPVWQSTQPAFAPAEYAERMIDLSEPHAPHSHSRIKLLMVILLISIAALLGGFYASSSSWGVTEERTN